MNQGLVQRLVQKTAGSGYFLEQVEIAQDSVEGVVDLMHHGGQQFAYRGQLAHFYELKLDPLQFALGFAQVF